jgi:hypothetical protein
MCGWVSDAAIGDRAVTRSIPFLNSTPSPNPTFLLSADPGRVGSPTEPVNPHGLGGFAPPCESSCRDGSKVTEHSRSVPPCQSEMRRGKTACSAQVASSCTIRADCSAKNRIPARRTCRRPSDVLPILLGESCFEGLQRETRVSRRAVLPAPRTPRAPETNLVADSEASCPVRQPRRRPERL